jgi:hypothetical protein
MPYAIPHTKYPYIVTVPKTKSDAVSEYLGTFESEAVRAAEICQQLSLENGNSEMTLDEINAEIAEARKVIGNRKQPQ